MNSFNPVVSEGHAPVDVGTGAVSIAVDPSEGEHAKRTNVITGRISKLFFTVYLLLLKWNSRRPPYGLLSRRAGVVHGVMTTAKTIHKNLKFLPDSRQQPLCSICVFLIGRAEVAQ